MLCLGGQCNYKLKPDSNVSWQFILDHVVPNTKSRVGDNVAYVIRKALLCYFFSDSQATYPVPADVETRICNAHEQADGGEGNLVAQVCLFLSGDKGKFLSLRANRKRGGAWS